MNSDALIERLLNGQDEILRRVTQIELALAEKKGERKAVMMIAGALGSVGGVVVGIVMKLVLHG